MDDNHGTKKALEVKKEDRIPKKEAVYQELIPSVIIDGIDGILHTGSTVRINLVEERFNPTSSEILRFSTLRLIIPLNKFEEFVKTLEKIREQIFPQKVEDGKENTQ